MPPDSRPTDQTAPSQKVRGPAWAQRPGDTLTYTHTYTLTYTHTYTDTYTDTDTYTHLLPLLGVPIISARSGPLGLWEGTVGGGQ